MVLEASCGLGGCVSRCVRGFASQLANGVLKGWTIKNKVWVIRVLGKVFKALGLMVLG